MDINMNEGAVSISEPPMIPPDEQRERFERRFAGSLYAISSNLKELLERTPDGDYYIPIVQATWWAWNAALAEAKKGGPGLVRYCHECGYIGEIEAPHLDCCPDGKGRYVHPETAKQARAGLKAAIRGNAHREATERLLAALDQSFSQLTYVDLDGAIDGVGLAFPSIDMPALQAAIDAARAAIKPDDSTGVEA